MKKTYIIPLSNTTTFSPSERLLESDVVSNKDLQGPTISNEPEAPGRKLYV